jgi:hypothetical protein
VVCIFFTFGVQFSPHDNVETALGESLMAL